MLVSTFLIAGLLGVFLVNFRKSEDVAWSDRASISLLIAGIATLPLSVRLAFISSFALLILGAICLAIPSRDFYQQRNARRSARKFLAEQGGAEGLCPNCDFVLPVDAPRCHNCDAEFGPGSAWKVG